MFNAPDSPYLVPFNGKFAIKKATTSPPDDRPDKKALKQQLNELGERLDKLQRVFNAHDRHSILLVFQGMDAAGKDSTIRAVLRGINPAGCRVFSFKQPTSLELGHDFLWRTNRCLPESGSIAVFNRSYYEEVLIVRVHPELLEQQKLPNGVNLKTIWQERFTAIRNLEEHLARNGTVILKFWLNVSREEQRKRFLSRLDEPHKHWKFSLTDVQERSHWQEYMAAFEDALAQTSRSWAPWYAIPADNKPYMRVRVAELIVRAMESLAMQYPQVDPATRERFGEMRKLLEADQ
jgi:PPK2 family polyphosphate:nucleotide phosphotransferase